MKHSVAARARYAFLLILVLLSVFRVVGQPSSPADGEILFARLANGEPGGEGFYVINADGTSERTLLLFDALGLPYDVFEDGMRCPAWSPDGSQIAFNGYDPTNESQYIAVVSVDGSDLQRVVEIQSQGPTFQQIHFPQWTPDGTRISFAFTDSEPTRGEVYTHGIAVVDIASGEVTRILDGLPHTYSDGSATYRGYEYLYPFFHAWSPDGTLVASAPHSGQVTVADVAEGSLLQLPSTENDTYPVDWSPDGSMIATALHSMQLVSPDGSTSTEIIGPATQLPNIYYESLSWSPDGAEIAYITYQPSIQGEYVYEYVLSVISIVTGETRELLRTPLAAQNQFPHNISCVDWRPSGAEALPPPLVIPPTATPAPTCTIEAARDVNLRAEPRTSASVAGSLAAGMRAEANGQTEAAGYTWYHLTNDAWVRGDIVSAEAVCAAIPTISP